MLPFALVIPAIHKKGLKNGVIQITPYAMLVGIYLIIRAMIVDTVLGEKSSQPIFTQTITMAVAAFDYAKLLIIPYPLSPFYPARWHTSIFDVKVIIAIIVLASLFFFAIKIRKDRIMFFLFLFPFILLFPVIWRVNGFSVGGGETMSIAERYLYAPAMMFSLSISASVIGFFSESKRKYIITGCFLTIVIFTFTTISANRMWKNDAALFEKIVKESPDAVFAHNNLGLAYNNKGQYDRAIEDYNRAIALNPNYAKAYNNRGAAYALSGNINKAILDFQRTCDMGDEDGCKNLQEALQNR